MDMEEINDIIKRAVAEAVKESASSFEKKLEPVLKELRDLQSKNEARFSDIEVKLENAVTMDSLTSLKSEMKTELKKEFISDVSSAHRLALCRDIEERNRNLIIFNLQVNSSKPLKTQVSDLLSSLHPVSPSDITQVFSLGKGKGSKTPAIHVSLINSNIRNEILKNASNLPKGVQLERDIPPPYRLKYKEFKRKAFKLRHFLGVQTQISFSKHILQLKFREKEGNKGFSIREEFFPSPEKVIESLKGNTSDERPPSFLSEDALEKATRSLIISNPKKLDLSELKLILKDGGALVRNLNAIIDGEQKEGKTVLTFKSPEFAQDVAQRCNKKQVGDFNIECISFD